MPQLEPIIGADFSGGINKAVPTDSIADNELDEALNMDLNVDKSLTSRKGQSQYNSTLTGASRITSIYFAKKSVGTTPTILVTTLAKIYKDDGVGGWTDITGTTVPPTDTLWRWVTFNDLVIGVNGTSVPQKWNFAGNFADLTGSPPDKCADISVFAGRVILSNDADEPTAIHGCAAGNASDWTAAGDAFKFYVDKDNGQKVMGTFPFFRDLIILKRRGIYRLINPTNVPSAMTIEPLFDDIGCSSQWTIRQIGNELVWMDEDGVYTLRATQESGDVAYAATSKKIQTYIDDVNYAKLGEAVSVDVRSKNQYRISIAKSAATTNNHVLVRDYYHGAWLRREGIAHASYGRVEIVGIPAYLSGGYNGKVYKLENTEADAGAAFIKKVTTKRYTFRLPHLRKLFQSVFSEYEVTGSYSVSLSVDIDYGAMTRGISLFRTVVSSLWDVALWDVGMWASTAKNRAFFRVGKKGVSAQLTYINSNASESFSLFKYIFNATSLSRRGAT